MLEIAHAGAAVFLLDRDAEQAERRPSCGHRSSGNSLFAVDLGGARRDLVGGETRAPFAQHVGCLAQAEIESLHLWRPCVAPGSIDCKAAYRKSEGRPRTIPSVRRSGRPSTSASATGCPVMFAAVAHDEDIDVADGQGAAGVDHVAPGDQRRPVPPARSGSSCIRPSAPRSWPASARTPHSRPPNLRAVPTMPPWKKPCCWDRSGRKSTDMSTAPGATCASFAPIRAMAPWRAKLSRRRASKSGFLGEAAHRRHRARTPARPAPAWPPPARSRPAAAASICAVTGRHARP